AAGFTANTINSLTAEQLKTILLYHAIPASLLKAEIPETPNAKLITAAGDSVFITRTGTGVFVNGIEVNDFDLIATNGIIHRLSGVLAPPTGNLMQTATANPDFSFFLAAVVRASSSSTPVAQLLASDNIFTVFAPTNEAFKAAGWVSLEAITAVDPSQLLEIVLNHIVPGRHFSAQLTPGKMLASLSGKSLLVGSGGGKTTIKGAGSTAGSFMTATNIVARNGVVHVVEKLLLP
ncbi:MAG: fasciclin domain-containing protein, partial [Chitinophagaceae bacterium]